jgi:TetR/AcrR family transcriptional repressor of nem operon
VLGIEPLRKSKLEAAQTREAIVAAAADLIRRDGIAEASLADMMAAAGLTHGGFYRHFGSKEQLVAEALAAAGDKTVAAVSRNMAKGGVNAAIDGYLSKTHRDAPTPTCPFAALGSEIARSGKEARGPATEVLEQLFATLAADATDSEKDPDTARGEAITALSTMVGAMTLARIAADSALSAEILESARERLKEHLQR